MATLFWDVETRSAVSLRECGSHVYSRDPSTQVLCVAFAIGDGEPQLWLPGDDPPAVFSRVEKLIAHNFLFEANILENILVPRHGFPSIPAEVQHCTQRLAMANAYPAELDLLAWALGLPYRKNPAARRAMLQVSRPKANRKRKAGTIPLWDEGAEKLALLYERCKLDVVTTRAVWQSPKLKPLSETERRYQLQDLAINERGIKLDRTFAIAARDLAIRERIAAGLRLEELTGGVVTTPNQVKRILATVNGHGGNMESLDARAVAEALESKPEGYVRELLELRRDAARSSVTKFKKMISYASPVDDRMRGTLRMYGAGPGRWVGLGPQLQNLKKNESGLPFSIVDSVRSGDREGIAQYGNPLSLLGDLSRAALCAKEGHVLMSGDFSAVESVVLAWLAGEDWKLRAYKTFLETGDTQLEPYRVIARRMLRRTPGAEISPEERQLGKAGELACGFGGSVGAWRRIVHHDPRNDEEILAVIRQWRDAHPQTRKFWNDLALACRIAIKTGQSYQVAPPPQPKIVAAFEGGNLTLTLPSGRPITYPQARLVPSKFEDGPSDIEFMDNARGQWKPYRAWFGTFVENVVQGTARDLLAAAIDRFETRGIPVVFHCHDEVTVEVLIGSLSEQEFLAILLELRDWAKGLPLGGKVHSGQHYLEEPEHPAEPGQNDLERALDVYVGQDVGPIDSPAQVEREDDEDFIANLADDFAPLPELVSLPLTPDNKAVCPFHDEAQPSCQIYPDHFHCFGCGEHGDRIDWLTKAEGMTKAEAITFVKDQADNPIQRSKTMQSTLSLAMEIWHAAQPLHRSIAERYLGETRGIDLEAMPGNIHASLRFHPNCVFGNGPLLPCLIALMRDPVSDKPVGIQRTALRQENGKVEKIDRRMLGSSGVVKLWPVVQSLLVVGEGLETVLAAATQIPFEGVPLKPAWATLSSQKLSTLPVIPGIKLLIILADHDDPGLKAAEFCKTRWHCCGCGVVTLKPKERGTDFNDVVMRQAHAEL